jgi:pimeloyl-ACP methyl ester carboxylesterase
VGIEVTTPELPELAGYRIVPTTIEDIRASADALRGPNGAPVGAIGISFAGGLALLAAADDAGASRFGYVLAVGAHHSLERLATFYAGRPVRGPDGEPVAGKAHPYGARVITYAHAERFFNATDLPHARAALRLHLSERYRDARKRMKQLSPAGRARMDLVLDASRHAELGTLLLEAVADNRAALAAVSPAGKLAELAVPTYLIHGTEDPVIPSIETAWLARELPARARRQVLITPVLGHADLSTSLPAIAYVRIVRFMAAVLAAAQD